MMVAIREVVTMISEDNGGHLLALYGVPDAAPESIVDRMISFASAGVSDVELAAIEAHLAALTPGQKETVAQGEESEAAALMTPEVQAFLERAFEAPVYGAAP